MKNIRLALLLCLLPLLASAAENKHLGLYWNQPSTELPEWVKNRTVYEVNVRQFSPEGTFAGVEKDLERLRQLGVGILWFMPIHPIGQVNRKGPLGSYYSVQDYLAVNPEFGDAAAFRSLVGKAHALGMKVILDWVANHCAWDNPLVAQHPEFFAKDAAGKFIPPTGTDWTDVIQFDFTHPGVQAYLNKALRYWVEEFDVDGFRCDVAGKVPTRIWEEVFADLNQRKSGLFFLAESEDPDHQLQAFHAVYGWNLMHAFNEIAQGHATARYLDTVWNRYALRFPQGSNFLMIVDNHDENSWNGTMLERLGGGIQAFSVLSFTMDGIPLLYNGQEVGLDKRLAFFERDPIDWTPSPLTAFYQKLTTLKTDSPALATGVATKRLMTTEDDRIYAFIRGTKGFSEVLVVVNVTAKDTKFKMGSPRLAGTWTNVFTGEQVEWDESMELELKSWKWLLLQR